MFFPFVDFKKNKDMEKKYSYEKPNDIENKVLARLVNFNIEELTDKEIKELWFNETMQSELKPDVNYIDSHRYRYDSVEVSNSQWTRDGIVNAIIRDKYRIDEMEAITNNMAAINAVFMQTLVTEGIVAATKYLKESINNENTARFKEMQEWRAMAKKVAKDTLKL
jgi:hypothetical protein